MLTVVAPANTLSVQVVAPHKAEEQLQYVLWGFSCAETAGTAAVAEAVLRHGTTTEDPFLIAPINFAADGYGYPTFFPVPIPVPKGLFLHRVAGTTTFVFYMDYQ